jgi:hypothetical protein
VGHRWYTLLSNGAAGDGRGLTGQSRNRRRMRFPSHIFYEVPVVFLTTLVRNLSPRWHQDTTTTGTSETDEMVFLSTHCAQSFLDESQPSPWCLVPLFKSTSAILQSRVDWQNRRSWKWIKPSWIPSSFSTSSMISLHVLVTKLRTKVSVTIGTDDGGCSSYCSLTGRRDNVSCLAITGIKKTLFIMNRWNEI